MSFRTLLACGASVMLYPLALHVLGPLIAITLTPAIVVLVTLDRSRHVVLVSWMTGTLAAFLVQHTLWVASLAGTAILSLYQGLIWVPMAFAIRYARNRCRIPLTIAWPVVWCAGEVLRSLGPLGTLFGTLAVPKTTSLWMLQIVDLGGASLAAFPLAALQGWFADVFLSWRRQDGRSGPLLNWVWIRPLRISALLLVLVWTGVGFYGWIRLSQVESGLQPGPEVGVVATDVLTLPDGQSAYDATLLLEKLQTLSESLVEASPGIELIVWPEGMLGTSVPNRAFLERAFEPRMANVIARKTGLSDTDSTLSSHWRAMSESASTREQQFQAWVKELGVPILVGMDSWVPAPAEREEPFLLQNTAVLFTPEAGQDHPAQAKMRLYPLGEYLPLRETVLSPLVQFVLGAPRADYHAGNERFRYSMGEAGPRYAIALCSELKFEHLQGLDPGKGQENKPYELLVNIANEGLFQRNGMPEIFAFCATLRAIENRVTVVRSSNSGVSGFWSPTGESYGTVTNANGQVQSGMGAAELDSVQAVLRYRHAHERELLSNPSRRDELACLVDRAEQIRSAAAVEGYSSQRVYSLPGRTVFHDYGDAIKVALVGTLILLSVLDVLGRFRFIRS